MGSVVRDHHRWVRDITAPQDTEIDVTGKLTLDISGNFDIDADGGVINIIDTTPSAFYPTLSLKSTDNSAGGSSSYGPYLNFNFNRATPTIGDQLGNILFNGDNDAAQNHVYASITGLIQDETDGSEEGKLSMMIAHGTGTAGSFQLIGDAGKVNATIGYGTASTTTIAGDLAINGDAITSTGGLSITPGSGIINVISTTDERPNLGVISDSNDANSGVLAFLKTRGNYTTAGQDGDTLGEIIFGGYNDNASGAGPQYVIFGEIKGMINDASATDEEGRMTLSVASHDGEMQNGLKIVSGGLEDEVDAIIGNGIYSVTTIAGDLLINGNEISSAGALEIDAGGDVNITGQDVAITTGKNFYFDGNTSIGGSSDTYLREHSDDYIRWVIGGDLLMYLIEDGADGNRIGFDCAVLIDRKEASFSDTSLVGSGGTDDTDIDFRFSNKYRLEMTGDITTMNLVFPGTGNYLLVCTTNGDHDVTNWKVFKANTAAATTTDVMWAGGSVPAFTNNGIDIVSFYYDADEQQCYGVASLAFATP